MHDPHIFQRTTVEAAHGASPYGKRHNAARDTPFSRALLRNAGYMYQKVPVYSSGELHISWDAYGARRKDRIHNTPTLRLPSGLAVRKRTLLRAVQPHPRFQKQNTARSKRRQDTAFSFTPHKRSRSTFPHKTQGHVRNTTFQGASSTHLNVVTSTLQETRTHTQHATDIYLLSRLGPQMPVFWVHSEICLLLLPVIEL